MTARIGQTAFGGLRKEFRGRILTPADPEYAEARTIFNAMIDRRPGLIAQCAGVEDVVRALRFGRDLGLEIAVRGGGHGVAGKALTEGGLVIDLRHMNAVSVDPGARTATVGGGATPPGSSTRSACGRTRPTTSAVGGGPAPCGTGSSRGRP
jgi:hypothetical protein